LRRSLNDCVRFVYGLRLGDHVTSLQRELIGCPFSSYYELRAVLFIHRLPLIKSPGYLYEKLVVSGSLRTRRLVTPRNRTALYTLRKNDTLWEGVSHARRVRMLWNYA
jgi:hypothetical protein